MKKVGKKRYDIGKLWRGKEQPLRARLKRSLAIKRKWQEGSWKPWNKGKKLSLAHRKRLRKSNILAYKNKALRKKVGRAVRKAFLDENIRKKIDRSVTLYYQEHLLAKREQAEKAMNYFRKNPDAFDRFLKAGRNPLKKHLKTKQGFLVRSKGEQKIANFLFDRKISAFYESKTLFLDGFFCTPDFWLPKFKTYIEFYGGYPGSWKKKVIKNKLYKKYNLKVIGITPSELRELRELKRF